MDQVSYNKRHAEYASEQKAIARKYRALKDAVEPGSDEEDALDVKEEAEMDAARTRFQADVGTGPITRGF